MDANMPTVIRIDLEDTNTVAHLRVTMAEYEERLNRMRLTAPQISSGPSYRLRLLRELLEKGEVDFSEMAQRVEQEDGRLFSSNWTMSCRLVASFGTTYGRDVQPSSLISLGA